MRLLVTTRTGNEYLAANLLEERLPQVEATDARPMGLKGLVVVDAGDGLAPGTVEDVGEVEKVVPIERELDEPDVEEIARVAGELGEAIPDGASFAVRCTRRGTHEFTSQDVERLAGAAVLDRDEGHEVDLDDPDRILRVEVIGSWVGFGLLDGDHVHRKYVGKPDARRLTSKTTIVQRLYESRDPRGVDRVGAALGRSAQAFEVARLIVGLPEPTPAEPLERFTDALDDGIGSRHEVQRKAREDAPDRVPVDVANLHQMARRASGSGSLVVMTDPRGETLADASPELGRDLEEADAVHVFNGANEGLPTGLFSHADHVLDLAPSITYGTDQSLAAAMVALVNAWEPP